MAGNFNTAPGAKSAVAPADAAGRQEVQVGDAVIVVDLDEESTEWPAIQSRWNVVPKLADEDRGDPVGNVEVLDRRLEVEDRFR